MQSHRMSGHSRGGANRFHSTQPRSCHFDRSCSRLREQRSGEICFSTPTIPTHTAPSHTNNPIFGAHLAPKVGSSISDTAILEDCSVFGCPMFATASSSLTWGVSPPTHTPRAPSIHMRPRNFKIVQKRDPPRIRTRSEAVPQQAGPKATALPKAGA